MAYTTRQKVEALTKLDLSAIDSSVTVWIASVKAWIDRYCGRTFEAASASKYYDGNRSDRLLVDPFIGVPTEVLLLNHDGSTWMTLTEGAGADYVAYPLNETEKNQIVLMPNARAGIFARAFENIIDDTDMEQETDIKRLVKVTASFGASTTVPADVEMAATMLVGKIAEKREKGGDLQSESLGDYSHSFKDIDEEADALGVYNILDAWREPMI